MNEETQRLLRAMLEARRAHEAASAEQRRAWVTYLKAQGDFTGKFSCDEYPLGPFVVGNTLIEHERLGAMWPPTDNVFTYRDVIRCHTSD